MPAAGFSYSTAASHKIIMEILRGEGVQDGMVGMWKGKRVCTLDAQAVNMQMHDAHS